VSNDAQFQPSVQVPDGFAGSSLNVPHPVHGILYVKLRDNPSVVNQVTQAELRPSPAQTTSTTPAPVSAMEAKP
jgi:hypothetical protein